MLAGKMNFLNMFFNGNETSCPAYVNLMLEIVNYLQCYQKDVLSYIFIRQSIGTSSIQAQMLYEGFLSLLISNCLIHSVFLKNVVHLCSCSCDAHIFVSSGTCHSISW